MRRIAELVRLRAPACDRVAHRVRIASRSIPTRRASSSATSSAASAERRPAETGEQQLETGACSASRLELITAILGAVDRARSR